jgi:hypothetical protein
MKGIWRLRQQRRAAQGGGYGSRRQRFRRHQYLGTPQQILDKLDRRRATSVTLDLTIQVSYGGMTPENAEASMRLFAEQVLPEVQSWKKAA